MEFLDGAPEKNNVYYLSEPDPRFEEQYLAVREKEQRVLTDEAVKKLPYTEKDSLHASEWQLRAKSSERVFRYCKKRFSGTTKILDIGCGNGWFTALLSNMINSLVIGLDINKTELEQAARVFSPENCRFAYGDIDRIDFGNEKFDLITLNASIQYFPDLKKLLERLSKILSEDGEIHIIDSPFYAGGELASAKSRSFQYYRELGFEGMSSRYFHHSFDDLSGFQPAILYNPDAFTRKICNKLGRKDSPFPWIRIQPRT